MKNSFGNNITVTLFGESHGEKIGAVLDGLAPGVKIDEEFINHQLFLRKPQGRISTSRVEEDKANIVSGVFNGFSTGTPITILIDNKNTKSKDYGKTYGLARPGHADYVAYKKYNGYEDYRGGGHFSGRITTPLVAVGAILISALKEKGIYIGSHIVECMDVKDKPFSNYKKDIEVLNNKAFATLSLDAEVAMKELILNANKNADSVGGIIETAIIGLKPGLGEPWFDSLESMLSHAMFSIPAVKGIEFGLGFEVARCFGSEVNDALVIKNNKVTTTTNNNGGINGGISNGMPIIFRTAVKPTPSIYQPQQTINFLKNENSTINIEGRHDPAIFPRARVVIDSMSAIVIADMLATKYGTDYLGK